MKQIIRYCVLAFTVFALTSTTSRATTHVIQFGGSVGFVYSPSTADVAVGDTVKWVGSFSSHPLVADEFPAGAASFATQQTGSEFTYVIMIPGTYHYHCQFHGTSSGTGMAGSFSTDNASAPVMHSLSTQIYDIMPNPATKITMIDFELATAGMAKITIVSIDGKVLATPLNAYMEAGGQMINYDCSALAAGTYLVTLEANGMKVSKRVVVEK